MNLDGQFDPTGVEDAAPILQAALNKASDTGEIVEWSGRLRCNSKIIAPPFSKIRGNKIGSLSKHCNVAALWTTGVKGYVRYPAPAKAWDTTLILDVKDDNWQFVGHEGTHIVGIAILDATQGLDANGSPRVDVAPTLAPPCILGNGHLYMENVELINCYMGVFARGSCLLYGLHGTPFKGIKIDGAGNGAKVADCWFTRPLTKEGAWHEALFSDGVGLEVRACDGINIEDFIALMYGTGMLFDKSEVWPDNMGANGRVRGFGPDWCKTGVHIKNISWDLVFDSVALPSPVGTEVIIDCPSSHDISFDNCSIGSYGSVGYITLKKGNLRLSNTTFNGSSSKPWVENLGGNLWVDGKPLSTSSYKAG